MAIGARSARARKRSCEVRRSSATRSASGSSSRRTTQPGAVSWDSGTLVSSTRSGRPSRRSTVRERRSTRRLSTSGSCPASAFGGPLTGLRSTRGSGCPSTSSAAQPSRRAPAAFTHRTVVRPAGPRSSSSRAPSSASAQASSAEQRRPSSSPVAPTGCGGTAVPLAAAGAAGVSCSSCTASDSRLRAASWAGIRASCWVVVPPSWRRVLPDCIDRTSGRWTADRVTRVPRQVVRGDPAPPVRAPRGRRRG